MSEIGIKDQCFGVEVEMTGITREEAAKVLAGYFGTEHRHTGGAYDTWSVTERSKTSPTSSAYAPKRTTPNTPGITP